MRKLIALITLIVVLALPATAAPTRNGGDRTPRERDNPIVRIYKAAKRLLTPVAQEEELPVPPLPGR